MRASLRYAVVAVMLAGGSFMSAGTALAASTASASQAASAQPAESAPGSAQAALIQSFESGDHVPGSAVGGIRTGSLHVGSADGTEWAIATFVPAKSAGQAAAARFQDGGATGVFSEHDGSWRLVRTGPYGCATELPAALRQSWGVTDPAGCSSGSGQAAAARKSLNDSGSLADTIVNTALSQVGVSTTPTVTSFAGVDCDPYSTLVAGFSANEDGCGSNTGFGVRDDDETWCSDFNKWVWEQAGVTADGNTLNAGSVSFYAWALDQGQTPAIDSTDIEPGDSLVFFGPGAISPDGYADHVGVVTSVNSDGTIDMANGDFLGSTGITVEYDTDISLPSWSAAVWGAGEQWVVVTPPTTAQEPVPAVSMSGPRVAGTGTTGSFHAAATEAGGSISEYYWNFGDGRTTNTTGADVNHVFFEDGEYTVTVTVTSSFGTITTKTWNVDVLGASGAVAVVQSDAVWFATTPIDEYLFTGYDGELTAQTWDGASWLDLATGGQLSATGQIAALSYPDPAADYATTPHAYYRAADGSLAQTYLNGTSWVTQDLPGNPAAGSAIVAMITARSVPAVFYTDAAGHLAETIDSSTGWTTRQLPVWSEGSLALAATTRGSVIFSTGPAGLLTVTTSAGSRILPAQVAPDAQLAAVTLPDGRAAVFIPERRGSITEVTQTPTGWKEHTIPGTSAGSLAATTYLESDGSLGTEVFYPGGVTYDAGSGWQTATLPSAGTLVGAEAYQVAGQPSQVFTAGTEYSASAPAGPWTATTLPDSPATFADQVVLYAATAADATAASSAATAAGLPASQVTTSYATAWDDVLSGNYLVIAVGLPATDGLYFNACGWTNPSGDIPNSTPFYTVGGPLDALPGAGAYEEAAGATAAVTTQLATDLAYYAVHGSLPAGVSSLPAEANPEDVCSGSSS
jgi:hypothetical protein